MGAGLILGFYSEEQALASMHFGALGLLLGMMILVSILAPTGFFQYIAIKAGQLSRGYPWRLLLLLGVGTAVVSLFFNNVTTVVLVGPITIVITELLGISPIPILMAQALLSDRALARRLGERARRRVGEELTPRRGAEALLAFSRRVLRGRASA